MVKYCITVMYILCCSNLLHAQLKCFAKVALDRNDVYIQQPFKVTYTVLTATWYTQPPEFNNIQIPGAFVVPFTQSQAGRFTDHGTDYSGIEFYYIVFPYKEGMFSVPSITITVATPPEGSAVSSKVTLHTTPVSFVVKPIPKNFPADEEWLVASDVTLSDHWSKPLGALKVGDVIERTVTTNASGTLPQFIPAQPPGKVSWAEVYPGKITLKDTRNDYTANGERVQSSTWLLTKAGTFELPPEKISWWNPYAARLYTRTLPAVKLQVADNPQLGMLTTLKDSLDKASTPLEPARKGPLIIAGMIWYKACLYAATVLLLMWLLYRSGRYLTKKVKYLLQQYRQSESYWFRKFMKNPGTAALYQWWDRWRKNGQSPAVAVTLRRQQETGTLQDLASYEAGVYGDKPGNNITITQLKHCFRSYRSKKKRVKKQQKDNFIQPGNRQWTES
ncbi:BatD family protein [Chitinophaga sp. CC14]|uniref:BatD family protein n=1 Tax=Chitinophaga sp. CC14 TaxID=3029199 RepID=UPI003B77029E